MNYLDFEDDIKVLDQRVQELKAPYLAKGITIIENPSVVDAERRLNEALERAYGNLNRWQKTKVARHEFRPRSINYIQKIFPDFTNLSGDRLYGEDQSVLAGFATLDGISVLVIGNITETSDNTNHSFGNNVEVVIDIFSEQYRVNDLGVVDNIASQILNILIPDTQVDGFDDADFEVFPIGRSSSRYLPLQDGDNYVARKIITINNLVNQK